MNTRKTIVLTVLGISSLAALSSSGGVGIEVVVPAPTVVVQAPAPPPPAPVVVASVPDSYVYDGTEYVGVVGTSYFYLGPDHVWLPFDSVRVGRFHDWERGHADWREHSTHNEIYRNNVHEKTVIHEDHPRDMHEDHSHDGHDDHHDDHGH